MKKLNLAIIGQGRSGKDIHGSYYLSERNEYYTVKYVVEADAYRRELAEKLYDGCEALSDYRELFDKDNIDLVVNASFSEMHYEITKQLLLAGKNVLVEKPFARTKAECDELIGIAKEKNLTLAVFQQTFLAPFYIFAKQLMDSGKIGEVKQVSLRYNGLARRWDWQTLQKKCAGSAYNTGPHPIGMALGFLDFAPDAKVVFSRLGTALTSGDADDYVKIILSAEGKADADIEISSIDAFSDYTVKLQGTKGTFKATPGKYKLVYIVDGENPPRPVIERFLENEERNPMYCSENLVKHTEEGTFNGNAFDIGAAELYKQLYFKITENRPMEVTAEMAADVINVIETVHKQNPLPQKFF